MQSSNSMLWVKKTAINQMNSFNSERKPPIDEPKHRVKTYA
jgi:hypothetical protein